jgi:hypothetical protein
MHRLQNRDFEVTINFLEGWGIPHHKFMSRCISNEHEADVHFGSLDVLACFMRMRVNFMLKMLCIFLCGCGFGCLLLY